MVFISQPEVSQLIRKGVLTRGASLKQWYKEYLDNLRKVAQGWSSRDGLLDRIQEAALLDRRIRKLRAQPRQVQARFGICSFVTGRAVRAQESADCGRSGGQRQRPG